MPSALRRLVRHPVYKALHRPLTVCGVERRLFFLALLMGAATFNLFYSFLAGLLMFGALYAFALFATKRDPQMLQILLASSRVQHALRRRRSTSRWISRCDRAEGASHPPGLRATPAASTACSRLGDSSTTRRSSRRRAISAWSIASTAPTTSASTQPSAATSSTASKRRCDCSASRSASTSTCQSDGSRRSSPTPAASASSTRPFNNGPTI